MQFEGFSSGSDDYSSGFGVIAEPSQQLVDLDSNDTWVRILHFYCPAAGSPVCADCDHVDCYLLYVLNIVFRW